MATIKEIIDQEKPVFDYLNYALRLAAWGIGLALSFQINRTNADPFFHAVNLVAIGSCAALGLFALLRFGIMNVRIAETFASHFATTRIERAAAAIAAVWPVLDVRRDAHLLDAGGRGRRPLSIFRKSGNRFSVRKCDK